MSNIPQLRVEKAGATGCVATHDASMIVTTCGAAKASAVARCVPDKYARASSQEQYHKQHNEVALSLSS